MQATDDVRRRRLIALGLVAGVVLANAAFVAHFGLRTHALVIYDEKFSVEGARWLHGDLHRVLDFPSFGDRGVERLTPMLLLPLLWAFGSTAMQLATGHVLMSVLFALQAVPAFLIARGLGGSLRWGLVAAALAVFGPWAVFGTVFLNSAPAACAAAFALWAMWRAVTTPSPWWDGLALALLLLATLARVSSAALAIAFPLAVVAHAFVSDWGRIRGSPVRRVGRLGSLLVRRHWVLVVLGAVALIVAALDSQRLVGTYPTTVHATVGSVGNRLLTSVADLAAGSGFLALAIGGGWVVRQVLRPRSREASAFAVLALAYFAAVTWVNLASGFDERYELALFVPLAVAFAAALARREVGLIPTAAGALVCWLALHRHGDIPFTLSIDYLTYPSREWLSRFWLNKAQYDIGIGRGTALDLVCAAATAAAIALALARGRWERWARAAVAGFVLAFALVGSGWIMQGLSSEMRPGASFSGVSFVDELTGGKRADPLGSTVEADPAIPHQWGEVQFFNSAIHHPISLEGKVYDMCCNPAGVDQVAAIDHETGAVTSDTPLPEYVTTVPEWLPAGFATRLLFVSSVYAPNVRLERLTQPPRAGWISTGLDAHGWVRPKRPASLRVFPAGAPGSPACLRATLRAPMRLRSESTWRIGRDSGRLAADESKRVDVPLPRRRRVDLRVTAAPAGPDPVLAHAGLVGLSDLRLVRCGQPEPQPRAEP